MRRVLDSLRDVVLAYDGIEVAICLTAETLRVKDAFASIRLLVDRSNLGCEGVLHHSETCR